jgi:hypothetical protein
MIAGVLIVLWVIGMLMLPKVIKEESPLFDMGLVFAIVGLGLWVMTLLAMKYSPTFSAFGVHTTLEQASAVDFVKLRDMQDGKEYEFGLFPHGGCKVLAMAGGGSAGYSVARMDLLKDIPGDNSNVWCYGIPDIYRKDAPIGGAIRDLSCLPLDMFEMVQLHKNWNPKAIVLVYWNPPAKQVFDLEQLDGIEMINFQHLWEDNNKVINKQGINTDYLLSATTKIARTNLNNAMSYSRERANDKQNRKSEEDYDDRE